MSTVEPVNDEEFRTIINIAVAMTSNREVANLFRVSLSTINRWMTGTTSPHPKLRESITDLALEGIKLRDLSTHPHILSTYGTQLREPKTRPHSAWAGRYEPPAPSESLARLNLDHKERDILSRSLVRDNRGRVVENKLHAKSPDDSNLAESLEGRGLLRKLSDHIFCVTATGLASLDAVSQIRLGDLQ